MNWAGPLHSKSRVNRAGRALADGVTGEERTEALRIAGQWRSAHAFPLNTIQMGLRKLVAAATAENGALVSQRLKRTPSTIAKLQRFPTMQLTRMQDIGGCRAVVSTVARVRAVRAAYARSRAKHRLVGEKDYIADPKESGYRSVHLVFAYRGTARYDGFLIEVQLRSKLQHAWATAVETAGAFQGKALKSSEGEEDWLRFFALVGSAFANRERRPPVPGTPPGRELGLEIRQLAGNLRAVDKLREYGSLIQRLPVIRTVGDDHYFLLERRPDQGRLYITGYGKNELARADETYLEKEAYLGEIPGADIVLVSADSVAALRRAYPNYRLDTTSFLRALRPILAE